MEDVGSLVPPPSSFLVDRVFQDKTKMHFFSQKINLSARVPYVGLISWKVFSDSSYARATDGRHGVFRRGI
jgi:hypothetical protein